MKKIMIEKMVGEINFLHIDEESFLDGIKVLIVHLIVNFTSVM